MALAVVPAMALAMVLAALAPASGAAAADVAPTLGWDLVDTRPHDIGAFTQGLVAHRGVLIESTGDCCPAGSGRSSIRRVDPRTGAVRAIRRIPAPIFAEGVTVLGNSAWQLTWTDGIAFRVSPGTLRRTGIQSYPRPGWGLTTHRGSLIASDGTDRLHWLRAPSLRTSRSVQVRDGSRPVPGLNELETLNGLIWANIFTEDRIAIIDPVDGRVRAWLDLSPLRERVAPPAEVLNGIARDPVTGHVIVTGKYWNRMFVIRLDEPVPSAS